VNQSVGSIKFVDDFAEKFGALVERSNALRAEMMATGGRCGEGRGRWGIWQLVFGEIQKGIHRRSQTRQTILKCL
jgi:hypothetical protein